MGTGTREKGTALWRWEIAKGMDSTGSLAEMHVYRQSHFTLVCTGRGVTYRKRQVSSVEGVHANRSSVNIRTSKSYLYVTIARQHLQLVFVKLPLSDLGREQIGAGAE